MQESDAVKQEALTKRLREHELKSQAPLLVSLEEFFDGNDDYGSIGCNLSDSPGPQGFYKVLRRLRDCSDVQDVLVQLHGFEDESMWPFSEIVHVLTSRDPADIRKDVEELQPDEVGFESFGAQPENLPMLRDGYRVVSLWWD